MAVPAGPCFTKLRARREHCWRHQISPAAGRRAGENHLRGFLCDPKKSMSGSRKFARPLTILLLLAVLVSQLVAFAPEHSDDHAKHCCPVCHASHAPLLSAAAVVAFTPPSVDTCWR